MDKQEWSILVHELTVIKCFNQFKKIALILLYTEITRTCYLNMNVRNKYEENTVKCYAHTLTCHKT